MVKRKLNIERRSIKNTSKRSKVLPLEDTRFHYNVTADFTSTVSVGEMNVICLHCNAKRFQEESLHFFAMKVVYN